MGMFDYLQCEVELPDGWKPEGYEADFQTKDFERIMTTYRIDADGYLHVRKWDMQPTGRWYYYDFDNEPLGEPVYVEKPEAPVQGVWPYDGPWEEMVRVNERWETVPFHGIVRFYSYTRTGSLTYDPKAWHEYDAKFTDGRCVEITKVER